VSSELVALALAGGLLASVAGALLSKKVSNSLISLFYAALILGTTFTYYGDALLGLLTMVTFAGAVSVLLLTVILITGEPSLTFGKLSSFFFAGVAAAIGVFSVVLLAPSSGGALNEADSSLQVVQFVWTLRPWDLLILMVVFSASMVSIASLLQGEPR
jgi:hypothetical protein